jgi:6-phosphogluconate dehydrogenase
MRIGFIGLGKMGYNMILRLLKDKHEVVAYNRHPDKTLEIAKQGAIPAKTYKEIFKLLPKKDRVIWIMVSQNAVDEILNGIKPFLRKGDIIVDGGNSNFNVSKERAKLFQSKHVNFLDIGVSGGLAAANLGYCMMIGGNKEAYEKIKDIIKSMCIENGYLYVGESGTGHFSKMVHNAIEYGMMEAIAEGFELLKEGPYKNIDLEKVADLWNHGSIIRGFLMQMTKNSFEHHNNLNDVPGFISDSGEGRWAVEEALKYNIPFLVNTQALYSRFRSRKQEPLSNRLVAAVRNEFGGHGVGKK